MQTHQERKTQACEIERERAFRLLFEGASDAIFLLEMNENHTPGRYLQVNEAASRMLGYTPDELLSMTPMDVGSPSDEDTLPRVFEELATTGTATFDWINVTKDSKRFVAEIKVRIIDFNGVPAALAICRDVTERKEIEEALRQSEERFRTIFESSQDAMMLLDETGFLDCNPRALETFGFDSKDEFITVRLADVCPPFQPDGQDSLSAAQARIETALREGTCAFEWVHRRRNGEGFPAEVLLSAFELGGRRVLQATVRDITERKQTDAERDRISEEIHDLYNNAPCGYHSLDASGTFIRMNDTELSWLGYSREEIIGKKSMLDILTPRCQTDFIENFPHLKDRGFVRDMEAEIVRKDGTTMPVLLSATAVTDAQGNYVMSRTTLFDITERKRAEEALREADQLTQEIISSAQEGIMVYDRDLRCQVWNPFMEQLSGTSAGDVLGRRPLEVFPFLRETAVMESLEGALAGETPRAIIFPYGSPDAGHTVWTSSIASPLRNAKGEIIGVIDTVREITEQKKAQDDLKLRNLLLSTQQEASIDGILVVDENGAILSFNQRFAQMWGVPQEVLDTHSDDLALKSVLDTLRDPEGFIENVRYLYAHQQETSRDEIALRDGRTFDRYSAPVLGADGTYFGRVWYFRDITERKQAEEALARHSADLARSNADLQQFAYVASHDLQEPLRTMSSYIQLLAGRYEGKLDKDADEFIGFAVEGAHRMQALISGLLDFSRVGTTGKPFEPVDCDAAVKAALDNLQVAIKESNALVTHDPLPTVIADAGQLTQLLQNLIGNAIKYHGDSPPQVHVSAEESDEGCIFSISDNGIGIAAEHFDRIFQIFQRLHAKGEYPGTGMGLAICKRIIERHSGRIWVESEVGKGSTFRFAIPCNLPASEADGTQALAA